MTSVEEARDRAERDAERNKIFLCPIKDQFNDLLMGLVENEIRYGYPSCPCRFASGDIEKDRDIICPCDYREQDVEEYGQCYCGLFVNDRVFKGEQQIQSIPERRPINKQMISIGIEGTKEGIEKESQNTDRRLLYCKQCGYTIFREDPPYKCPICQAKRELFAEIMIYGTLCSREIF